MRSAGLLVLCVTLATSADGAERTARALLDEGWTAVNAKEPGEARALFAEALREAQTTEAPALQSEALRGLATADTRAGDYAAARARLDDALRLAESADDRREVARVLNGMGSVAWYQDPKAAQGLYERAIAAFEAAGDPEGAANAIANLLLAHGEFDRGAWRARGAALARQSGDPVLVARYLQMEGDLLRYAGDYGGARAKLAEARALFASAGRTDKEVSTLNSLGFLHRLHGRADLALAFQREALALARGLEDPYAIVQSLAGTGLALRDQDRLAEAAAEIEAGLALARSSRLDGWVGLMQENLAAIELDRGRLTRAAELTALALARPEGSHQADLRLTSAAIWRRRGRWAEALAETEKAVAAARVRDDAQSLPRALAMRARCLEAAGRREEAVASAREALDVLERQRGRLIADDSMRQGFAERMRDPYALVVGVLHRLGRPEEALEAATRARARAFLDRLAAGPRPGKTAPAASVADVRALARRLDSTVLVYFFAENAAYAWAVGADGLLGSVRLTATAPRLARMVAAAQGEIRYGGVGRGTPRALATRGGGLLLMGREEPHWRRLYDLLIAPLRASLPRGADARLTVIADGPLLRLSFGALREPSGRYLLERYTIHYAPAVVPAAASAPAARGSGPTLLVGAPASYPRSEEGAALPPLPGSGREIDGLAALLGPRDVRVLRGADATEAGVRRLTGRFGALHISTHGVVRDDAPLDSFVALTPGRGGDADDGRLTMAEVYALELRTDLVFLSACRTARGGLSADGVLGFTRAFFHAGASSVVAALWDVVDEPSQRLALDFYRARLAGADNAQALRAAQLALLRDLRQGRMAVDTPAGPVALPERPAFWAPFVLLGEP